MKKISARTWQSITIVLIVVGILIMSVSGLLHKIIGKAVDPLVGVQGWVSTRVQTIVDFFTLPRDVTTLMQQNAALEAKISQLQTENLQLKQQLVETEILYALLDFARDNPENQYVAASVIGKDPSPFLNYLIIDHGSDNGIFKGMPVVTEQGLVGRIDAVTASAARVQLITDAGSTVNIRLQDSQSEGQVSGSVTGDLSLERVSASVTVKDGELVFTSGLGGSFPAEILVGQVVSPEVKENELFQTASVQPSVDFSTLRAVLIITNFQAVEIEPLVP